MQTSVAFQKFSKHARKSKVIVPRTGNTCVMYNRVSSKYQMINGNSLDWQNEQMEQYAEKNKLFVKSKYGGTFESAKTDERKEFQRMLAEIKRDRSIASILVYCYDRFSRSGSNGIFLLENLKELGIKVIAITQELDTNTATGKFQESLFMLLSKLDNDMRKDKILSGTRSILRKGYWPYMIPMGYDNLNKHTSADKHILVINGIGNFIQIAFKMKASGKYSLVEIAESLRIKGWNIKAKTLSWIFSNKFYCGFITSSLLPGELIKGNHPAVISEEVFMKANSILLKNPRAGIPKFHKNDELPLKVFAKDEDSISPFTSYINKKKKLAYYKTRVVGSSINISAKSLNSLFKETLEEFQYNTQYKNALQEAICLLLKGKLDDQIDNEKLSKKRITELKSSLDKLEERFVMGEISREQYQKFFKKFQDDLKNLECENPKLKFKSSNLDIAIQKGLEIAENIGLLWENSTFEGKQKLQYLVFPDGILYSKKKHKVRTSKVNSLFAAIPLLATTTTNVKNKNEPKNVVLASNVENSGVEPLTSCMPCKRSTN